MEKPSHQTPLAGPFLDEKYLAETISRAKKQIRKRMRALRSGHGEGALSKRSARIVERLGTLQPLIEARSVALFWPMLNQGEVDLRPLDAALRQAGKRIYYPFMSPSEGGRISTGFALTHSVDELVPSTRSFLQPKNPSPTPSGDIDLVLVPALAADPRGHRIGYGAGFYDATLGDACPPARAWIVVYHFQLLAELPVETHDRDCDGIVTDEAIVVV